MTTDNHDQALGARARVVAILQSHTKEMEGYSYFGSNPGISEDDYDEIADEIVAALREARVPDERLHCMCDVHRALGMSKKLSEAPDELFSKERANEVFANLVPRAKDGRP